MSIPNDVDPDQFDKMVARHARQLGEHCAAVVVVAMRDEPGGASGIYFRTAGNHHLAEKGAQDFVDRARVRREVRYREEAEAESFRPPDDPPPLTGDEWKE